MVGKGLPRHVSTEGLHEGIGNPANDFSLPIWRIVGRALALGEGDVLGSCGGMDKSGSDAGRGRRTLTVAPERGEVPESPSTIPSL
jgi:hypothetical protein